MKTNEVSEANILISRAELYEEAGEYNRAEELLSQAVVIQERDQQCDPLEFADTLHEIGLLNVCLERRDRAETYLNKALEIRREFLGASHPDCKETFEALSSIAIEELDQYTA